MQPVTIRPLEVSKGNYYARQWYCPVCNNAVIEGGLLLLHPIFISERACHASCLDLLTESYVAYLKSQLPVPAS